jgi:uncharacterized surface protein with fasciclin (FAS1) repeats
MSIQFKLLAVFACAVFIFPGCKKWDDHISVKDQALAKNLLQQVSENASLSKFSELLSKSGYDKILASSKTFTVFAPTNTVLANLDPAIVNDTTKLKAFVGNYIANQSYFTSDAASQLRIEMLNGKYHDMLNKSVEDAAITEADKYAKNGVLHIIDKMLPVLDNTWEALQNNTTIPSLQKNYLLSLFRKVYDVSNAVQTGIDPLTGEPVYQPGTDSVQTNLFWKGVHDLRDESKEYTLFVLTDAAWNSELTKFNSFYVTSSSDSTTQASSWAVVKDLAVDTLYKAGSIPDTILSKFNVKVPVDKASIVQTIKTSNGVIYVMDKVDVKPEDKFQQFYIEAENYRYTSADRRSNTYFRDRYNPVTGKNFRDVEVFGHGVSEFNINYRLYNVPNMKYKAYWVALNDFQTAPFSQKLGIGTPTSAALGYVQVAPNNYNEVYLGEFTVSSYQPFLDVYLTAAKSTTAAVNPLVCDYIRIVPSF